MEAIVTRDPNVMHGTPCFAGTRVAVQTFFDHLEAGCTIDAFLDQFPTVRREQVVQLLALAERGRQQIIDDVAEARAQFRNGETRPASIEEIMREIES